MTIHRPEESQNRRLRMSRSVPSNACRVLPSRREEQQHACGKPAGRQCRGCRAAPALVWGTNQTTTMIKIPVSALKAARKLLTRLPFTRCSLPVLGHVLARTDAEGITLAVTDLDSWLETRITLPTPTTGPAAFLIPSAALAAAVKADKGSEVILMPKGRAGHRELKLITISGGMRIESMHSAADWEDFPDRPSVEGPAAEIPAATFDALKAVAPCASRDEKRQVLGGVLFSPEDGNGSGNGANGMLIATDGKHLAGPPALVPGPPSNPPGTRPGSSTFTNSTYLTVRTARRAIPTGSRCYVSARSLGVMR
jgi:hypothetical protein